LRKREFIQRAVRLFPRFSGRPAKSLYEALSQIQSDLRTSENTAASLRRLHESRDKIFDCFRRNLRSDIVAKALTLKSLNVCLARHQFHARSSFLVARPYGVEIDPSNNCTLACPACVHSDRISAFFDWPSGTLAESRLASFLKRYGPYAVQVMFCNYGEPLLNVNTPRFIRTAKRYLAQTMLSTSLSLRRFDPVAYIESGLDYMVLSIDGASQAVYERFRKKGSLELVCDNIRKLLAARQRLGKRTPVISWQFLAFRHNWQEIPLALHLARELGVDEFRLAAPFDVSWDDPEIQVATAEMIFRSLKLISKSKAIQIPGMALAGNCHFHAESRLWCGYVWKLEPFP
jgi:pyruvate-formate lyase-activating enzyme